MWEGIKQSKGDITDMTMFDPISGFSELLPWEQRIFNHSKRILENLFELWGFTAIETPVVERLSVLLSKGSDHEIYGLRRLSEDDRSKGDSGSGSGSAHHLGLRFDLTVPLARYVAQHYGKLVFPFRRYHIAPVWRGERPQKGRGRQFYQCDIDSIGDGSLSSTHEAEVIALAFQALGALGFGKTKAVMRLNNRKILTGWALNEGLGEGDCSSVLRILDKKGKIPDALIGDELKALGLKEASLERLFFLGQEKGGDLFAHLSLWKEAYHTVPLIHEGISELEHLITTLHAMGISSDYLCIAPLLARGLGYYTGNVYEIFLPEHRDLGSVCAGGRYDNLVNGLCAKSFPGVGLSIGLTRLWPALLKNIESALTSEQRHPLQAGPDVVITMQEPQAFAYYWDIAQKLRENAISTEIFLEEKSLKSQLKTASRRGTPLAIIASLSEIEQCRAIVRNLYEGTQHILELDEIVPKCRELLSSLSSFSSHVF